VPASPLLLPLTTAALRPLVRAGLFPLSSSAWMRKMVSTLASFLLFFSLLPIPHDHAPHFPFPLSAAPALFHFVARGDHFVQEDPGGGALLPPPGRPVLWRSPFPLAAERGSRSFLQFRYDSRWSFSPVLSDSPRAARGCCVPGGHRPSPFLSVDEGVLGQLGGSFPDLPMPPP